jgi:hypothetical protein
MPVGIHQKQIDRQILYICIAPFTKKYDIIIY